VSNKAKFLLKYGCSVGVVVACAVGYILGRDMSEASQLDWYRILSDAFTLPGLLLIFSTALVWLSGEGAFDGIAYCGHVLVRYIVPGKALEPREKYSDFVERRRGKKNTGYGFLLITGGISLAIGIVFLVLFHMSR